MTPQHLKDTQTLLTKTGFTTSNIWYHGTSSALVASIQLQGLKRSGDQALNDVAKATMATIGNNFQDVTEPVFLTQSKELAFYWAQQTVRERGVRFGGSEEPVVIKVNLNEDQQSRVKPDVGAMSLLMMRDGEAFMARIAKLYQDNNLAVPEIDLRNADRMDFLNILGMAYINEDISRGCIEELRELVTE